MVCALMAAPTVGIVVYSSVQTYEHHLAEINARIRDGIASKGRVLSENHALALRGMTLDNAFTDIQELASRAVRSDPDLIYAVYVATDGVTLAYVDRRQIDKPSSPVREAWNDIGLTRGEFFVTELQQRDAQVFGERVLEVAAPVQGEARTDPPLGTIRYGFSLGPMHQALLGAEQQSRQALRGTLTVLLSCIGLAALLGLGLSRRQALRITDPITDLTRAANALAAGERHVRVVIDSGDELQQLGGAFNTMVDKLDASYRELEAVNRSLEQRVADRTKELSRKNRDMRAVLDNVDQGLLKLSNCGQIVGTCSKALESWFGPMKQGDSFARSLEALSREFSVEFELGWEQLADGLLPVELCLGQLPATLSAGERVWSFRYLPLGHEESLEGVLVVVVEVTDALAKQAEEKETRETIIAFRQVMADRTGFSDFVQWASPIVQSLGGVRSEPGQAEQARQLHTLKGTAGVLGLEVIAECCHALEDEQLQFGQPSAPSVARLQRRWAALNAQLASYSSSSDDVVEVPRADYDSVLDQLQRAEVAPQVTSRVQAWQWRPVTAYFKGLAEQARALARRLGKESITVHVEEPGLRLDPQRWNHLMGELGHVVRNAIDHGIESAAERAEIGKPNHGALTLRAEIQRGQLLLELSDDGRGLDIPALRERGARLGQRVATDQDAIELVYQQGLSTRDQAGLVSGRGVGMAAVRAAVARLGGHIDVSSRAGHGTCWTLRFPAAVVSDSVWGDSTANGRTPCEADTCAKRSSNGSSRGELTLRVG